MAWLNGLGASAGAVAAVAALGLCAFRARAAQPANATSGASASRAQGAPSSSASVATDGAGAGATPPAPPEDDATKRGREAYLKGLALAREGQWGEALGSFEEAARARDAPRVQFNVAYCLRALGHYVAAREATRRVLADPSGLAPQQLDDAKAFLTEFERTLVEVTVTLDSALGAARRGRPTAGAERRRRGGVARRPCPAR